MMAEKSKCELSPRTAAIIRLSRYMVHPSFNQLLILSAWTVKGEGVEGVNTLMLPAATGDQVTTPAVAQLMGNDIDILSITTDDSWCGKGKDWILHSYACSVSVG
jgi:hypothetical protein